MREIIKLKRGFNIKLVGKAVEKIETAVQPEVFAVKPTDFVGMQRPKCVVKEGSNVKAGTPVLIDKAQERVLYTAPVCGEVIEIKRGEKRRILEIKILADKVIAYEPFSSYSISDIANLAKEAAKEQLLKSGVWPNIIQRPYGIVADPEKVPKAIFISSFDTHPLAPSYDFLLKEQEVYFQAGIDILKKFTEGIIHLGLDADTEVSPLFPNTKGVNFHYFSGPHPKGNVGVQMHHIDPINKGDIVWTVSPFGVAQIGKLFLEGKYDATKLIALVGSEVINPQYYRTYTGACIHKFVKDNLKQEHVRLISGNVLTGEKIAKDGFMGYYHLMVTVIPEGDYHEMFGWIKPTKKLSLHRALGLLSFLNKADRAYSVDTNTHGEPRAFVQTGVFEKVMPMDILPTYLLKAILAEDLDEMEALGIYEVIEEDMALCEFVDVSKHDVQKIVRQGLDLLRLS
ncbi:MAG: Na(+)-translocating NADH-quinone reductase subunit A [Cytophagales bacterium]|nr:Na(+)-translocating NADH-quinone reductase subunit A [Cytophagales bacterium]